MMKKLVLFALLVSLLLSGCGANGVLSGLGGRGSRELRMNVTASGDSVWQTAANTFKELVEERTEGRYKVRLYTDEQLSGGDIQKGVENLFTGETDLDLHSLADMQSYINRLAVVSMPWIFSGSLDRVDEILLNGPGKDAVFNLIRARGAEPLALGENGFRQLTNDVRSILSPVDCVQLRVGVPADSAQMTLFRTLGADPVAAQNRSGLFTALQEGTLDGEENAPDTIRSERFHLTQRFLTLWNCSYDPICLSVSAKVWENLSEEDQAIFRAAAEEACAAEILSCREAEAAALVDIASSGVEITHLTDEDMRAFRAQADGVYVAWRDIIGDDLFAVFGYSFG